MRQYIWLRYSTQFTTGGRTHTIEMEVPVPVGASAELREQLIREAEANMEHLYRRVEARARGQRPPESVQRSSAAQPQAAQQAQQPPHQPQPSQPVQPVRPVQRLQPLPSAPGTSPQPAPTSMSSRASAEGPQAISLQDRRAGAGATPGTPAGSAAAQAAQPSQAQTRPTIPGELPVTPGLASAGSGTMKLSEFIQIIRDNWGLSAKQAMDLLQVKSLNNMNYRDLLRQLEPLVEQAPASTTSATSSARLIEPINDSCWPIQFVRFIRPCAPFHTSHACVICAAIVSVDPAHTSTRRSAARNRPAGQTGRASGSEGGTAGRNSAALSRVATHSAFARVIFIVSIITAAADGRPREYPRLSPTRG